MLISVGSRLGRYEIRSHLGTGGMGEVYLAQDISLGRPVALKLLPANFKDEDRLRRFEQEARAVSALNHPNILTIYEIGAEDALHFIATEFIDGGTLREHMTNSKMKIGEVLEIVIQVASALSAAHSANIVHRDIKPENIMVRRDGYIKILDFGLAKLTERRPLSIDTEAPTMISTEPGVVMGTANYMSPEQAQGLPVNARTDIWSLGVVLYEMVAGRAPFEGPTFSHVIVSILEKEPPAFTEYIGESSIELQRIVNKALRKDPEERYQTARDLMLDLKNLRQELEFQDKLERSVAPNLGDAQKFSTMSATQGGVKTAQEPITRTAEVGPARPTLSAEHATGAIKRRRSSVALMMAALAIVIAGAAFGLYKFFGQNGTGAPFQSMKIKRLTTTGKVTDAAISPDGKYVVHVVTEGGQQGLLIRQVATPGNVPIVPPAEVQYRGLTYSHDGTFIYYVVREKENPGGVLYQVPALTGVSKKLITGVDWPITFSPDRKRFAFVRNNYPNQGEKSLMVANADGSNERRIVAPQLPNNFWSPAWSPDGRVIACAAVGFTGGLYVNVIEVGVEDGAVKPITSEKWFDVGRVAWLRDGSGLLITATAQWSGFSNQIWHLSYPAGAARKITDELNNYRSLSLTADSSILATVQADLQSSIWTTAPNEDASRARQITSGTNKYDGYYDLSWTPDGKIVYESTASGHEDIWIMDRDGNNQKQLTDDAGINLFPAVSPDGRYIVFASTRDGGNTNIWRMDIDGSNPRQLTKGSIDNFPSVSPDGQWVVYMSNVSGKRTLWKVRVDGGEPVQLTDKITSRPVVSPDGKSIACYYFEQPNSPLKIVAIPFEGGQPAKVFDIATVAFTAIPPPLRWAPDGRALAYVETRGGISNIWSQPVDGGRPVRLTDFKADRIFSFDWSRDGFQLACARGAESSDVVLISDSK